MEGRALGLGSLPRWTELPTGNGFCMLMRGDVRAAVGLFNPAFGRGYNEENDWSQRVRSLGLVIARANRALVLHRGEVSFSGARKVLEPDQLAASGGALSALSGGEPRLRGGRTGAPGGLGGPQPAGTHAGRHLAGNGGACRHRRSSSTRSCASRKWKVRPGPGGREEEPADVVLAPLDHETPEQGRRVFAGSGRLITVLDAWRPVRHGWDSAQRWAQFGGLRPGRWFPPRASPTGCRRWVVPGRPASIWPLGTWIPLRLQEAPRGGPVVLVSPPAAARVLVEEAIALLGGSPGLQVLEPSASASASELAGLRQVLRGAHALVDFGGTSAGWLADAVAAGVPVIWGLLSVGDGLPEGAGLHLPMGDGKGARRVSRIRPTSEATERFSPHRRAGLLALGATAARGCRGAGGRRRSGPTRAPGLVALSPRPARKAGQAGALSSVLTRRSLGERQGAVWNVPLRPPLG